MVAKNQSKKPASTAHREPKAPRKARPKLKLPSRRVDRRSMLAPTSEEVNAVRQATEAFVQAGRSHGADSQSIRKEAAFALKRAFNYGVDGEVVTITPALDLNGAQIGALFAPRDLFRLVLAEYGAAGRPEVFPDSDREGLYAVIVVRTLDELLGE